MSRRVIYNRLKSVVSSGSDDDVRSLLSREAIVHIHGYLCENLPSEQPATCLNCEQLLTLRLRDSEMVSLLINRGAFPPFGVCASQHPYGENKASAPLNLAVKYGSLDDVRKLLLAGADVNLHPGMCVKFTFRFENECTHCDTPLMAAVRRRDVTMMRLLIAHGANISEAIHSDARFVPEKTALFVAAETGDEQVITELVKSGADVNQSLGPRDPVLHHYCDSDKPLTNPDPKAKAEKGASVFWLVLFKGEVRQIRPPLNFVLQSLRPLLPTARYLEYYLQSCRAILWLNTQCTMLLLQHGARILYYRVFLEKSPQSLGWIWSNRKQHSEEFIELLQTADTDFSGVRERINQLDRTEWEVLNLDVLKNKLSQPLTLQTSCVISVRRRLRNISDVGMLPGIDALPLPTIIKDQLKLIMW